MPEKCTRYARKLIRKGAIVEMYTDCVMTPDGKDVKYDFIKHKGAAAVVPVLKDGKILMVRQYRNAIDQFTLEIPAGGRNGKDEPTIDTAFRELEEETGYKTKKLEPLISLYTTVAFCDEKIDIFVARNLTKSKQKLDDDEYLDVESYELDDLIEKIYSGEIADAKTMAALLAYKNKYVK